MAAVGPTDRHGRAAPRPGGGEGGAVAVGVRGACSQGAGDDKLLVSELDIFQNLCRRGSVSSFSPCHSLTSSPKFKLPHWLLHACYIPIFDMMMQSNQT